MPGTPIILKGSPLPLAPYSPGMKAGEAPKCVYLDILGVDLSGIKPIVEAINSVVKVSREAGMQIVFLQNGWHANLHEVGTPTSPHWHKSNALRLMRKNPELNGKLTIKGTWDYDFIDDIKPQEQDYIIQKPRYSGFWGTNLDMLLRGRGIRNLIFTGVATNVCVESTLRDAFFLEYFSLVIADATLQIGPQFVQEATLFNIEKFFGWVSTTKEYLDALKVTSPVEALQVQTV